MLADDQTGETRCQSRTHPDEPKLANYGVARRFAVGDLAVPDSADSYFLTGAIRSRQGRHRERIVAHNQVTIRFLF